ncbi:MAG: PAS domain S-box protein [Bacteroidales bacterium]|nr:PAS domain S-box protein [Bacteroidales bacterium]
MGLKNLRFRTKLILGFVIIIAFSLLISFVALIQLNKLQKSTELIYKHPLAVSNAVREIKISVFGMHCAMKDVIIAQNQVEIDSAIFAANNYKIEAIVAFDIVFDRFLGDIKDVEDAYNCFKATEDIRKEVLGWKLQNKNQEASDLINSKGAHEFEILLSKIDVMADFAKNKADEFKTESENRYKSTLNTLIGAISVILGLSILIAFLISKSILIPIHKFISHIKVLYNREDIANKSYTTEEDLFAITISELKSAYLQIEDANHELRILNEDLDGQVKIRTQELEQNQTELKDKNEEYAAINEELTQTIEELQDAKSDIEASELHYKALFENSPVPMWEEDFSKVMKEIEKIKETGVKDFRKYFDENPEKLQELAHYVKIVEINNPVVELHEADSKEQLLKGLSDIFTKESFDAFKEEVIAIAQGLNKYEIEGVVGTLQGNRKDVHLKWVVVPGYEKSMEKVYVSTIDITDKKKAENLLIEREQHLRTVFDAAKNVSFIRTDLNGEDSQILDFSPGAENIFGYKAEEVIGKKVAILHAPYEYKNFPAMQEILRNSKTALSGETVMIRKSGELFTALITINPIRDKDDVLIGTLGVSIDISDRKRAEDVNKIQSGILANMSEAVYLIRKNDGIIMYTNEEFEKLFGYSNNEMLGKHASIVNAPTDKTPEKTTEEIMTIIAETGLWQGEINNIKKDGTKFWCQARVSVFDHPQFGEVLISVHRDITERKIAEKLLKESEKEYRTLVENIPGVTYRCANDEFWTMEFLSDEIEKLTGYPSSEFINNKVRTFASVIYSEDIQSVQESINKHLKTKSEYTLEYRIVRADGEIRWVFEKGQGVCDSKGNHRYLDGVIIDITERKRGEQIQKVLYNISNAVNSADNLEKLIRQIQIELGFIIDTTNFYIALYDKSTDSFSLPFYADEKDQLTNIPKGKTLTDYVLKTKKSLLANIGIKKKLVDEGHLGHVGTISKIWLGVPLRIEGRIVGVLAVQSYTDEFAYNESDVEVLEFISDQISLSIDRKRTEEELLKAKEHAEESDRLKSAFLANMSHEIRTPMNGILGFAKLLQKPDITTGKLNSFVEIIINSSNQLLNIVNDILDISKIETGQIELYEEEIDLNKVLRDIRSFFGLKASELGLELILITELKLGKFNILIDKSKLKQIIYNLIGNSLKFTKKGSIEFGYKLEQNSINFFVKDTGIGIPKKYHAEIFNRFNKLETNLSELHGGTGLGLAICKGLVEGLGGKISVISEENKGTTFTFKLPLKIVKQIETKSSISDVEHKENIKSMILIVEDEEINAEYLKEVLHIRGINFIHAKNGAEALKIFKKNKEIDLVLMDLKMPIMDGFEATKEMKKIKSHIPIIAQTAYAMKSDRIRALDAGCDDYISKPIVEEALFELIKKHLANKV